MCAGVRALSEFLLSLACRAQLLVRGSPLPCCASCSARCAQAASLLVDLCARSRVRLDAPAAHRAVDRLRREKAEEGKHDGGGAGDSGEGGVKREVALTFATKRLHQ